MKTAIYIEQGVTQLVLTPDNEWEKAIVDRIKEVDVQIHRGGFYECCGGWYREQREPDSLMLIMREKKLNPHESSLAETVIPTGQ